MRWFPSYGLTWLLAPICGFSLGLGVAGGGVETLSWFVGLRGSLPSMECRSLPTAAIGLSLTGFLGVCLVLAILFAFGWFVS